ADFGLGILLVLLKYSLVVIAGLILQVTIVYSSAIKIFSKHKIRTFFRGIRPAQLIVFSYIKPIGSAFIRLISMVVPPLVFASLLVGTASLNDIRKLGRIGAKTVAYYLCTTIIAISIGLLLANTFKPGEGLSEEVQTQLIQSSSEEAGAQIETTLKKPTVTDILLNIIPTNPVKAFVEGKMLQIIFLALMAGICLSLIPTERSRPVINFFEGINELIIQMVHIIMKLAPYGVFALISGVVADFGLGILLVLLKYSLVVIAGLI
ncbi:unnamed protein product, partial [marine sediment metagenome]